MQDKEQEAGKQHFTEGHLGKKTLSCKYWIYPCEKFCTLTNEHLDRDEQNYTQLYPTNIIKVSVCKQKAWEKYVWCKSTRTRNMKTYEMPGLSCLSKGL